MARANLGRTNLSARALGRFTPRACPVCGERKPPRDFQFKRHRSLSLICSDCLHTRRDDVTALFARRMYPLEKHHARIIAFLTERGRRRIERGKEVTLKADKYAELVAKLPDRVAAVVGKTYAVMGDAFELSDDEALMRIRDLLLEIDVTLIDRNKYKRLARGRS